MAKLRFKKSAQLAVITRYDEDTDDCETTTETFQKGEECEVDLLNLRDDAVDVQFGDGDCCYCIPLSLVEIEATEEEIEEVREVSS